MQFDELDSNRAGLFLCLARAFATPTGAIAEAMRSELVGDLRELADALTLDAGDLLDELTADLARQADAEALLATYARLFLVPGDQHPSLNTAAYLDGTLGGGSMHAMAADYAACGLAPHEGFHDLPDHVSVQLEFVAWLFAARAEARNTAGSPPALTPEAFLQRYVARWLGPLLAAIGCAEERFGLDGNPYRPLAVLLQLATASALAGCEISQPSSMPEVDPDIARLRAEFANRSIGAADLAEIRERLASAGLAHGHVEVPVAVRDAAMGMESLVPPKVPFAAGGRARGD